MKRNEFKLLFENWRQNLVLETDAEMVSNENSVDEVDNEAVIDEEISDIEMALEIDKEIDEDDECGY